MALFKEFLEKVSMIESGFVVAALTDEYIVDVWPMNSETLDGKEDRILEVRVFNTKKEIKLFRTDVSREFVMRDSSDIAECDTYTEEQYLDIDETKGSRNGIVTTTGGGKYRLPFSNLKDAYIVIENYLSCYSKSGQARIFDWRMVDIKEGK